MGLVVVTRVRVRGCVSGFVRACVGSLCVVLWLQKLFIFG